MPKFAGWNSPAKVKRVLQATLYLNSKRRRSDLELPPSPPEPPPEAKK